MRTDEVHDDRPLSKVAERLSDYKRATTRWKQRDPKKFAAAAIVAGLGVLAPGIVALIVGASQEAEPPETTSAGLEQWVANVWNTLIFPTIGRPLISWSDTHVITGTDLPAYAPVILWMLVGGLVWLLGLGRSIYARVVWALFAAATALVAFAGATPDRDAGTVVACVLLWLGLSLPVYRRRTPRPRPEPHPSWREKKLDRAEHYKRILDMAVPGSEEHEITRRYLDSEVRSLVTDTQYERAQQWAQVLADGKRTTLSMVLAGTGGYLVVAVPLLGSGVTVPGILVAVLSLPLLAMGVVEHSEDETKPALLGHTPTDRVRPAAMSGSAASAEDTETPSDAPVGAR